METWIDIQETPLDTDRVTALLYASGGGGVCVFSGTTRRETDGRITEYLTYEAHNSMALKEMRRLVDEANERWPLLRVVLLHRTGRVEVGEPSVIVGVASQHRVEAFEATRFLIDELKKSVQIWKKEQFQDGSAEWKTPDWTDRP